MEGGEETAMRLKGQKRNRRLLERLEAGMGKQGEVLEGLLAQRRVVRAGQPQSPDLAPQLPLPGRPASPTLRSASAGSADPASQPPRSVGGAPEPTQGERTKGPAPEPAEERATGSVPPSPTADGAEPADERATGPVSPTGRSQRRRGRRVLRRAATGAKEGDDSSGATHTPRPGDRDEFENTLYTGVFLDQVTLDYKSFS
ncbi:uncharacterized protein AB9W97_012227 isoform 1-T9 [Spinachia spinachia]